MQTGLDAASRTVDRELLHSSSSQWPWTKSLRLCSGECKSVTVLHQNGNKSMLFNAEYLINIAGPVQLILLYDAGQVKDVGQRFTSKEFITSTGAEIRFFMPVLNVPFRLIFAENPQRGDCSGYLSGVIGTCVLNQSTLWPEKKFR